MLSVRQDSINCFETYTLHVLNFIFHIIICRIGLEIAIHYYRGLVDGRDNFRLFIPTLNQEMYKDIEKSS